MGIVGLGYVGIYSRNLEAWVNFGEEILGTRSKYSHDHQSVFLRVDDRSYRIAVHAGNKDGLAYVGWEVQDKKQLEALFRSMEDHQYSPRWGTKEECERREVQGFISCQDPDGQHVEIFYGPLKGIPFLPTRPMKGFVTGDLGLGHVTLLSPHIEASIDFYTNVLGFRVSDYSYDVKSRNLRAVFLRCNRRHHSIALANVPGEETLHHLLLEVHDVDDVGVAYDLCRQKGETILSTLGRHTNDRMISFYVKSPSNFGIEYGCHGILVDDATWTVGNIYKPDIWGHQVN